MPARLQVFRQDDFTGGLNLRADQFQLAQNESPSMLNVEVDPRGGVFSRGGMRKINASPVTANWNPMNVFAFYGAQNYIMLSTGKTISYNGDLFYSIGSGFNSLGVSISSENGASFSAWGGTLYIATGSASSSYKWDGTTLTALNASGPTWQNSYTAGLTGTYMPKAEHTITHAGKMFVANTVENGVARPNVVRWSHPNSPENWAENDYIEIKEGGVGITGMATFGGHLVVFKQNAVYAIMGYDSDTFQVVEISKSVGCLTPHAIVATEHGVYFYTMTDGLVRYYGQGVVPVFDQIKPAIINGEINPAALKKVFVNYINKRVWVSVPYSKTTYPTYPSASFVYDHTISSRGAWVLMSTHDGRGFAGGCDYITNTGETIPVAAHATSAFVLKIDQYTVPYDDTQAGSNNFVFDSYYRTRWVDGGSYSSKKMWRRPDVVVKQNSTSSTIRINAYGDYEESNAGEIKRYDLIIPSSGSGMVWGSTNWGENWGAANVGSQIIMGRSIGLAKSLQLEFTGPSGTGWGINSFTLKYNPRRVKQ